MVRALLDGSKTQTRRIVNVQSKRKDGAKLVPELLQKIGVGHACPYGVPGDRLWVRETHYPFGETGEVFYRADMKSSFGDKVVHWDIWKPSIFMRRQYSRITLEITDVRVERLNDITPEDARDEGIDMSVGLGSDHGDVLQYKKIWESINGPKSWDLNPWVWALTFKRIEGGAK